jgi:hypothetical protein
MIETEQSQEASFPYYDDDNESEENETEIEFDDESR